jgi:hypothetical protein
MAQRPRCHSMVPQALVHTLIVLDLLLFLAAVGYFAYSQFSR